MGDPGAYLKLPHDLGYDVSVIPQEGDLVPCGQSADSVMQAHKASGVDHIDFVAVSAR